MKASSTLVRRAVLWSATGAVTAAMIVAGSSAQAAHLAPSADRGQSRVVPGQAGPGYPPPEGIYAPFTNCPLLNPLMQESTPGSATGCIAGDVSWGRIKIGNITTKVRGSAKVAVPVAVQFGVWDPPNAAPGQFTGGILPPPSGLSAQLLSLPQHVPGGLSEALGCPSSNAAVQELCSEAQSRGGRYLKLYASAQSAGPITNFELTTWTQPLEFQLINPLLGSTCYIGSADNPVVVNPSLTGKLVEEPDPQPKKHPDTDVLKISAATATDTTFTAPVATGCGPGGSANIAIDEAIDTAAGLPSASGDNSITLHGTFYLAACFAPQNMADILLSAFKASARASARTSARQAPAQPISFTSLRDGHHGFRQQR
jgi:hypothetical protein